MWSRIQSTAVNCTRWVSSCRHTQSRKSCGSTSSWRSAWTMLGATSRSRPPSPLGPSQNGSNWPRTLLDMNDISAPSSAPLIFSPTTRLIPDGALLAAASLAMTGSIMTLNVSRLASIQRGRSTTRTGAVADVAWRSLNSRTGRLGPGGALAQLGNGLGHLGGREVGTGLRQLRRRRERELPIDHVANGTAWCG